MTSYGNGMRLGRVTEPKPVLCGLAATNTTLTLSVAAAPGQTVVLSASTDLRAWAPLATNVVFTSPFAASTTSSAPARYFRAGTQ